MINLKVIGEGKTATVYEWQVNKVLKLFVKGTSKGTVEKEFNNAKAVEQLNFNKPKAYEIIAYNNRYGIIYDKVKGDCLLDKILNSKDVIPSIKCLAELHKKLLNNVVDDKNVLSYKVFLKENIKNAAINEQDRLKAIKLLTSLEDDNRLCHGDFHPGNVLVEKDNAIIIDFMNICRGPYLYDIARTVYLMQYTPVPAEIDNKNQFLMLKKELTDLYLTELNIKREEIRNYLEVIKIARKGECPNEFSRLGGK